MRINIIFFFLYLVYIFMNLQEMNIKHDVPDA